MTEERGLMLSGLHVLVVDDDRDSRDLLAEYLALFGARVTTAATADEAVAELQRARVDVIVTDISLSGGNGYGLIVRVRATPAIAKIPVVALTGYRLEAGVARAAGFNA